MFRVRRSDIDVHTYKSMQILKYGDGRDLFPVVIPMEILHLKVSLMMSNMIIN